MRISRKDTGSFVLVCITLCGIGLSVEAGSLPIIFQDHPRLVTLLGISGSLLYAARLFSPLFFTRFAGGKGFHWLLAGGLIFYAAALVGLAWATGTWGVLGIRAAEGITLGAIFVACDFILTRTTPAGERPRWATLRTAAFLGGLTLGPLITSGSRGIVGWLEIQEWWVDSPALPLVAVAIIAAVLGNFAWPLRTDATSTVYRPQFRVRASEFAVSFTAGFVETTLLFIFPVVAREKFFVKPEISLLVIFTATALSAQYFGKIIDGRLGTFSSKSGLMTLAFGAIFLVPLASLTTPENTAITAAVVLGVSLGALQSFAGREIPFGLGAIFGPILAALAVNFVGPNGLLALLAGVGAISYLVVLSDDNANEDSASRAA